MGFLGPNLPLMGRTLCLWPNFLIMGQVSGPKSSVNGPSFSSMGQNFMLMGPHLLILGRNFIIMGPVFRQCAELYVYEPENFDNGQFLGPSPRYMSQDFC